MLEIRHLDKKFAGHTAIDNLSLQIKTGEFFSLLGPSGCGKSTLLRLIAGLEHPSAGDILLDGQAIQHLAAEKRPFNMIFQNYALFPHLNVHDNVAFGLRLQRMPRAAMRERVAEALSLVHMEDYAHRHIGTLSGGQQQRVAIARALVMRPRILLLDEPLAALDLKLRQKMQEELLALQRRLRITFIFVTHAQDEAFALSDRIAVMRHGRIEQLASPRDLYLHPTSLFAAEFVGNTNLIRHCQALAHDKLTTSQGFIMASATAAKAQTSQAAHVVIRPEHLRLSPNDADNRCEAIIKNLSFKGPHVEVQTETVPDLGIPLTLTLSHDEPLPLVGTKVTVGWRAVHTIVIT